MSEVEVLEKDHNVFGGSTAYIWNNCYGWMQEVASIPYEDPGEPAIKGTALHEGILERYVRNKIDMALTGTAEAVRYDDIEHWPEDEGPEMAELFWNEVFHKALEGIITGKQIYIEKKLIFKPDGNRVFDAGGTGDFIALFHDDKAQIVCVLGDIKTGFHRVEPDEDQLLFYLCCIYLMALEKGVEIQVFRSFIFQPSHHEVYTEHTWTKKAILQGIKKFTKGILESLKPKPKYKVGEWCKWCKAKGVCKAYGKDIEKQMALLPSSAAPVELQHIEDEKLVNIFLNADKIEEYISAVKKHIIQRFSNGKPLPGLKIVEGVSKRKFLDVDAVTETLRPFKINPMVSVPKMITMGDLEKQLKAQKLSPAQVKTVMDAITYKPPGSPLITTADDTRPSFTLNAGVNLLEKYVSSETKDE